MQGQCVDPTAVQDWELEAYLDDDAGSHVAEHLKICSACQAKLVEIELFERRWRRTLHRFDCPPPDVLRDFAWGFLPQERRDQVKAHLAQCPLCKTELADLDELVKVEEEDSLESLLDRARRLAKEARLTIARLLSPTALLMVPALRGKTQEVLLFDADGLALSVNLEQEETGTFTLFGQILSAEESVSPESYARLTAQRAQFAPVRVSLDEHGGFALPNIPAGVYQLVVDVVTQRIVVPDLTLGSQKV
jgi:anti-sigma factor RsiW